MQDLTPDAILSGEQRDELEAARIRLYEAFDKCSSVSEQATLAEEDAERKRLRQNLEAAWSGLREDFNAIILPHQQQMIERLAGRAQFQRLGPAAALIDGWMGKHLKISDASKARIQGKVQSVIRQLQDETLRLRDDTNNKILDALTPQHRALVTQLLGEPIAREQCNPGLLLLQLTSWNSGQR